MRTPRLSKRAWKDAVQILGKKLPTNPPGLAGKIVKDCPLSEPIRLQDLEDSAGSQAYRKKEKEKFFCYISGEFDVRYNINLSESLNYSERLACEIRLLLPSSMLL